MSRYLLFISLWGSLWMACSSPEKVISNASTPISFWTPELIDQVKKNNFRIIFTTPKAQITGIFIFKRMDGEWRGTIINEFGLKVLDFVSTPEKCRIMNVIPFLNKWYIKKVMASDIQFIMEIDNPDYPIGVHANRHFMENTLMVRYKKEKELCRFPDGAVQYHNHQRKLTYSLKKIHDETER